MLSHIAEALRDIHAMNCVHGHVKPAHILHLRQGNRWTLTDFDRAASVGCPVPPVATLEYTSPENMHAAASGAEAVHASPAADCWALGVVAFELLTNAKALKPSCDGATAVRVFFSHARLPTADTVQYLGLRQESSVGWAAQQAAGAANGWAALHWWLPVLRSRHLSAATKLLVLRSRIAPCMSYGMEWWRPSKRGANMTAC